MGWRLSSTLGHAEFSNTIRNRRSGSSQSPPPSAEGIGVRRTWPKPLRRLTDDRAWHALAVRIAIGKAAGRWESIALAAPALAPRVGSHAGRSQRDDRSCDPRR